MWNAGIALQKTVKTQKPPPQGSITEGPREIHIDEEVKIAVNLSLERFRYSDQKGITVLFSIRK